MKTFYTYIWLRENGIPYYVGKGSGQRAFTSKSHFVGCPKDISLIILQDWPTETDAFSAEMFLIEYYGRIDLGLGSLRNRTNGGIGGICNKGKKHSPEHCRKISEALMGKVVSPEAKAKMRARKLGTKHSPEQRRKTSEALKKISCTTRIKPGQRLSPATEFKKGIGIQLGKKHTAESRAKMSRSQKARQEKIRESRNQYATTGVSGSAEIFGGMQSL